MNLSRPPVLKGEMSIFGNAVAQVIDNANQWHGVRLFDSSGLLRGFDWDAGSTGAITAYANSATEPGVKTTVTSAGHGLNDGELVTIAGTVSYNGLHLVSNVVAGSFDITVVFVADDGASTWNQASSLIAHSGINGEFHLDVAISSSAVVANETFEYSVAINETIQNKVTIRRKFAANDVGSMTITGMIVVNGGDIITLNVLNVGNAGNIINSFVNLNLHEI